MTITASTDHHEPAEHPADPSLDAQAAASLSTWFSEYPSIATEIEEAAQAHTHLQQEQRREADAAEGERETAQRAASLIARLDLAGQRFIGFGAGVVIVTVLLVFDAIPLNWAAQAFGLAAAATWLVTGILLIASAGVMAGLEMTREHSGSRRLLIGLMTAAYIALVVLRLAYLTTVAGESVAAAALQAILLSAISAGLVACGSAVMARTRPQPLARALAAARRARRTADAHRAARRRAAEKMQRHWAVLCRMLREWSITSPAPAGVSQAGWVAALERALRALFPEQP